MVEGAAGRGALAGELGRAQPACGRSLPAGAGRRAGRPVSPGSGRAARQPRVSGGAAERCGGAGGAVAPGSAPLPRHPSGSPEAAALPPRLPGPQHPSPPAWRVPPLPLCRGWPPRRAQPPPARPCQPHSGLSPRALAMWLGSPAAPWPPTALPWHPWARPGSAPGAGHSRGRSVALCQRQRAGTPRSPCPLLGLYPVPRDLTERVPGGTQGCLTATLIGSPLHLKIIR